jgi:hypothetical protein
MSVELPGWFPRFMNTGADRFGELMAALVHAGCEPKPVELAGGRFIVVSPRNAVHDRRYRMKILTAHHDRVPGTPGALDNSAACLQLWRFVTGSQRVVPGSSRQPGQIRPREVFNTVAVFTDREELSGAPVEEQGAYALGKAFAGLGYDTPLVLSLDVTGRGDALVLSSSCSGLAGTPRMRAEEGRQLAASSTRPGANPDLDGLYDQAGQYNPLVQKRPHRMPIHETLAAEVEALSGELARHLAGRMPVYHLPVPFGEDIGFMLAGIPALVCTVLPRREAQSLSGPGGLPQWASPVKPEARMPRTWSALHGPDDTVELYTESAFSLMERFLERVASYRESARPG